MSELEKRVLDAIERRNLVPRPRLYFLAKRSVFWSLAVLSVLLGAVSAAVIVYRIADHLATGGRGFDEMPFDDVAEVLPGIWLLSFVLFVASAVVAVSQTRRGYRYPRLYIVAAVVAASVAIGAVLHAVELGPRINRFLLAHSELYREHTYIPYAEWSRPDEGFLGGAVLSADDGRSLRLRDFNGGEWTVDISAAEIGFSESLVEEGDVAIRGERTGRSTFKATHIDEFD